MQKGEPSSSGGTEIYEDDEDFIEEEYEEQEESFEDNKSQVTPSEQYSHYDSNTASQFVGYRVPSEGGVITIQVPQFVTTCFTGASLSADNFATNKHILCCKYGGFTFTLARLLPNQIETQSLDFRIPAVPLEQEIQLYLYNPEGGAVDVGIVFSLDEDMMENNAAMIQEESSSPQVSFEQDSESQNANPKEESYNQEIQQLYQQQARAKALEYKISRANNGTNIKQKDLVMGNGKTALSGQKVNISYEIFDYKTGKVIEKLETGKIIQFTLGTGDALEGVDQLITGMRVGGTREGIGPSQELMGTKEHGVVRMVIKLLQIE